MRRSFWLLTVLVASAVLLAAQSKVITTKSGLKYADLKVGTGEEAVVGSTVNVIYSGWLHVDGKRGAQFDSNVGKQPLTFEIGQGRVIKGWEEGLQGMKVGGRRELFIPPDLGYGARGYPGLIPPNSILNFEVELVGIKK